MFGKRFFMAMTLVAWGGVPAIAADEYTPVCELKGTNGMVTMLFCPDGLSAEALAEEGRTACDGRKPCGAWVWTDVDAIPDEAPDAHDKLPKESIRQAVAIWVNEKENLITLTTE